MRRRLLPLLFVPVGLALLAAPGHEAPTLAAEPKIEWHADVVYGRGGDVDLKLDLARPAHADRPLPTVVVLHGGGWVAGDKRDVRRVVELLAEEGFVAAAVQYRLARPTINGLGRRNPHPWPAQIEDAKCAVRYLRQSAERWSIDGDRVAALGFSAGAHLAMLLGTMGPEDGLEGSGGHAEQSSCVQAVISFFGPTDMGRARPANPAEIAALSLEERADVLRAVALSAVLGPVFLEDPTRASPLRYASPGDAPMLLFQGTRDTLVPPEHAVRMMDALTEAEVPGKVVFHVGKGHGRGWRSDPVATDSMQDVLDFLDQRLRPTRVRSLVDRLR